VHSIAPIAPALSQATRNKSILPIRSTKMIAPSRASMTPHVLLVICRTPNGLCPRLSTQGQWRSLNDAPPEYTRPQLAVLDAHPE
jgi:hypothetical protein